mmetsp:Transcript_8636/g.20795  ORF Transcript_8636/g.20795 Transcript_8636/m.20795 type:complete len:400 (+) Transcript_8636:81-1280(+)
MAPPRGVRVATYNVLSSHLCDATHFTRCAPEHLDPAARLPRVLAQLKVEMEQQSVIALQEISMDWTGQMHAFFAAEGYHFVTALYGRNFNGYMGVGLAWPTKEYEVIDTSIKRISETRAWPRGAPPPSRMERIMALPLDFAVGGWRALRNGVTWALAGGSPGKKPPFGGGVKGDPLPVARDRHNQAIAAMLRRRDDPSLRPFVVTCYHMPCMFRTVADRQVMLIHAALYAQWAQRFAATARGSPGDGSCAPHVIVGDWNVQPSSSAYALLTGSLAADHPERPPARAAHDRTRWSPDVLPGGTLRSAYALASPNGLEPEFTNNAWIGEGPAFREALDFIFLSKEWQVRAVRPLPPLSSLGEMEFYPTEREPSDHLMLAAELFQPNSDTQSASRSAGSGFR